MVGEEFESVTKGRRETHLQSRKRDKVTGVKIKKRKRIRKVVKRSREETGVYL